MRLHRTFVCVVCYSEFKSQKIEPRTCSRSCRGEDRRNMTSTTYRGLGRYVVREIDGLYVAWDTERNVRSSLPASLQEALRRCLELERAYGVYAKAAA